MCLCERGTSVQWRIFSIAYLRPDQFLDHLAVITRMTNRSKIQEWQFIWTVQAAMQRLQHLLVCYEDSVKRSHIVGISPKRHAPKAASPDWRDNWFSFQQCATIISLCSFVMDSLQNVTRGKLPFSFS